MTNRTDLENTDVMEETGVPTDEADAQTAGTGEEAPEDLFPGEKDGASQQGAPAKNKKKLPFQIDTNQLLSSFLVFAYVICMYFVEKMILSMEPSVLKNILEMGLFVLFGLLLFYATRVGDGKQIRRFSLSVLLLIVVPGLYITLSFFLPLPLADQIYSSTLVQMLGPILLGYGIPYTFLSGFERKEGEEEEMPKQAGPQVGPDYVPGSTLGIAFNTEEGDALAEEEDQPDKTAEETERLASCFPFIRKGGAFHELKKLRKAPPFILSFSFVEQ